MQRVVEWVGEGIATLGGLEFTQEAFRGLL